MLWEWWSTLSETEQTAIFIAIPFFLFFMDLLVKNGFNISTETAGGDLCLAAVGLDISQTFIAMEGISRDMKLSSLLLLLALAHLFLWASSLRLVAFKKRSSLINLRIGISYALGLLAFYTSLGTIVQFVVQQGVTNG